jgi:hypothetical protein
MTTAPIYLTWLNNKGGFQYFLFKAEKEYGVDLLTSGETRQNILPNWGKSWGETADTIDKQTYRTSKNYVIVRSQYLTMNQLQALKTIRTTPLVQIVNSRTDRRTVLVDVDSFKVYDESETNLMVQFKITFTDDIPSQRL